jgi:hypothetical protein
MLDKNKNLLIFPQTREDSQKIMNCSVLLGARKKIDLSKNNLTRSADNRPKLVIFELTHEEATKYKLELREKGIVEVIDLQKREFNDYQSKATPPRIVKVIMISKEAADQLFKEGEITIKRSKFRVARDHSYQKQTTYNAFSFKQVNNKQVNNNLQQAMPSNHRNVQTTVQTSEINNLNDLFAKLNETLNKNKQETISEMKNVRELTRHQINKNNSNLALAITQVIKRRKKKTWSQ